jgi:hypothetical protein
VQGLERTDELGLGLVVEGRCAFVEDQHLWIPVQRPSDRHALALTARQSRAAFAYARVQPVRQFPDDVRELGQAHGPLDGVVVDVPPRGTERDVLAQRCVQQEGGLRDDADLPVPRVDVVVDVHAIHAHGAPGRCEEPDQEVDQGALASPSGAADTDRLPAPDAKIDLLERGPVAGRVAKLDAFERHGLAHPGHRAARRAEPPCRA